MLLNNLFHGCLVIIVALFSCDTEGRPAVDGSRHNLLENHHKAFTSNNYKAAPVKKLPHLTPLQYRKTFRINFPLKPKLFKHIHYIQRKNQSVKRDTARLPYWTREHVPFLRSINIILGSLLHSANSTDSNENRPTITDKVLQRIEKLYRPLDRIYSGAREFEKTEEGETTTFGTPSEVSINSENTESAPYETSTVETSHTVPELLTTTALDGGRANDGHDYGSRPRNHSDLPGSLTRDSRHFQHFSRDRFDENFPEHIPRGADDPPRNGSDGSLAEVAIGGIRRTNEAESQQRDGKTRIVFEEFEDKDKNRTGRGVEEITGDEGRETTSEGIHGEEPVQPGEFNTESFRDDTESVSGNQPNLGGNSRATGQDAAIIGTSSESTSTNGPAEQNDENISEQFYVHLINSTDNYNGPVEISSGYSNYSVISAKE